MKVEDLIVLGKKEVHSTLAKMLLADLLGMNTLELYNYLDMEVSQEIKDKYLQKLSLVKEDRPIQYVLGNVNFCGLFFIVNENVLIPRFETEELVKNTLRFIEEKFDNKEDLKIIDLGCGSGVIGLTLKYNLPKSSVTLLDISEEALEVAKKNASNLKLDVNFIKGDMLEKVDSKFDIIISNPPYIMEDEEIEDIVKNNEPHLALYGGKDGLNFYKKILNKVKTNLNDKFIIAFEIGYKQKDAIINLINESLLNVEIICLKDMSEKDRMIFISNK